MQRKIIYWHDGITALMISCIVDAMLNTKPITIPVLPTLVLIKQEEINCIGSLMLLSNPVKSIKVIVTPLGMYMTFAQ